MTGKAKTVKRTGDTEVTVKDGKLQMFWPCLVIEGMQTGDGRFIPPGSLGHRGLPLPVMGQTKTGEGHKDAEVFGHITRLDRVPGPEVVSKETGEPFPEGTFVWQAWGEGDADSKPGKLALDRHLTGNSADLADTKTVEELGDEDGNTRVEMRGGNIAGTTLVPVPAFADGYVEINGEEIEREPATEAMVAAGVGFLGEVDAEGYALAQAPTADKRKRAAAKGQAMPGGGYPIENADDLGKAIQAVGRAGGPEGTGTDRNKVRRMVMKVARKLGLQSKIPDNWAPDGSLKTPMAAAAWTIIDEPVTAAGEPGDEDEPFRPPLRLFQQRKLNGITPLTLEPQPDGTIAVYGHAADFSQPHISFTGQRVLAKPSPSNYRKGFNTGALRVLDDDDEERTIGVGRLTIGDGHADLTLDARSAKAVYDDPERAWAWVQASDDRFGCQVNGVVIPGTPDSRVTQALAHPLSGDWRPIDGHRELVAACCVNTAGIPVPRQLVASGELGALVAAGAVAPNPANPAVQARSIADAVLVQLSERLPDVLREVVEGVKTAGAEPVTDDLDGEHEALLAEFEQGELFEQLGVSRFDPESLNDEQVAYLVDEFADGTARDEELSGFVQFLHPEWAEEELANWVEKAGGLPPYIKRIAKHLVAKGKDQSQAIATAVNVVKKMCTTGDINFPGKQQVNAGSQAEACNAVKSWEEKKARS